MTLLLRKTRTHCRMVRWDASRPGEDDYVVLDGAELVGRIYCEMLLGERKWRWFLQTDPARPPNQGAASTLDEAKGAFKKRYEMVKRGR